MEALKRMRCPSPAAVIGSAVLSLLIVVPPAAAAGEQFSSYPSYSAKFDLKNSQFSLITSLVVYNISGSTLQDVTFRQIYPEGVTVTETYQRDVGTQETGEQSSSDRRIRENAFFASLSTYRNRQYVVLFNELRMARRLNQVTFPGVEIEYTDAEGAPQTVQLEESTYDLFSLSNVIGGLERYLEKQNAIKFSFKKAVPGRTEWEFAPIVASAQGRFPTGVIESFPGEDRYNGYFRVRSGAPGNNVQILVVYARVDKDDVVADQDMLMSRLKEYLRWCGEFEFEQEGLNVSRGKWKKYKKTWSIDGGWRDTIKDRLGAGLFRARVFCGPHEDVEYFVLGLVHGRTLGKESVTPNPEKEAQLVTELDSLLESFKSYIKPLSYER